MIARDDSRRKIDDPNKLLEEIDAYETPRLLAGKAYSTATAVLCTSHELFSKCAHKLTIVPRYDSKATVVSQFVASRKEISS